jgi:hypothetical protein
VAIFAYKLWYVFECLELIVVFDADMAAERHFFMKVLEVMWGEETALCLTPQVSVQNLLPLYACPPCFPMLFRSPKHPCAGAGCGV